MKKGSLGICLSNCFHGAVRTPLATSTDSQGANTCEADDPDALRIIYGIFCCVSLIDLEPC
jgi:hypothetical protein